MRENKKNEIFEKVIEKNVFCLKKLTKYYKNLWYNIKNKRDRINNKRKNKEGRFVLSSLFCYHNLF